MELETGQARQKVQYQLQRSQGGLSSAAAPIALEEQPRELPDAQEKTLRVRTLVLHTASTCRSWQGQDCYQLSCLQSQVAKPVADLGSVLWHLTATR